MKLVQVKPLLQGLPYLFQRRPTAYKPSRHQMPWMALWQCAARWCKAGVPKVIASHASSRPGQRARHGICKMPSLIHPAGRRISVRTTGNRVGSPVKATILCCASFLNNLQYPLIPKKCFLENCFASSEPSLHGKSPKQRRPAHCGVKPTFGSQPAVSNTFPKWVVLLCPPQLLKTLSLNLHASGKRARRVGAGKAHQRTSGLSESVLHLASSIAVLKSLAKGQTSFQSNDPSSVSWKRGANTGNGILASQCSGMTLHLHPAFLH